MSIDVLPFPAPGQRCKVYCPRRRLETLPHPRDPHSCVHCPFAPGLVAVSTNQSLVSAVQCHLRAKALEYWHVGGQFVGAQLGGLDSGGKSIVRDFGWRRCSQPGWGELEVSRRPDLLSYSGVRIPAPSADARVLQLCSG